MNARGQTVHAVAEPRGAVARARRLVRALFGAALGMTAVAVLAASLPRLALAQQAGDAPRRIAFVATATVYDTLSQTDLAPETFRQIAEALRRRGYSVTESIDERGARLRAKIARFAKQARGAESALFVYGGHGVTVRDQVFLLPREAEIATASDVFLRGLPAPTLRRVAGFAERGLVLAMTTAPTLERSIAGLEFRPTPAADRAGLAPIVYSAPGNASISRLNPAAGAAARQLVTAIEDEGATFESLARAVSGGGRVMRSGTIADLRIAARDAAAARATTADARASELEKARAAEAERQAAAARAAEDERKARAAKDAEEKRQAALAKRIDTLTSEREAEEAARAEAEAKARAARAEAEAADERARAAEDAAKAALTAKRDAEAKARQEEAAKTLQAERLAAQAAEAERRRVAAETELSEALAQVKELSKVTAETPEQAKAREDAERRASDAMALVKEAESRAKSAEQQSQKARAERIDAERAARARETENARLAKELAEKAALAEEERRKAQQELAKALKLNEQLAETEAQRAAEAKAREDAEARAAQAATRVRQAEARASTAEARLSALETAKAEAEIAIARLQAAEDARVKQLQAEAEETRRKLEASETEIKALKARAAELALLREGNQSELEARRAAEARAQDASAQVRAAEKWVRITELHAIAARLQSQQARAAEAARAAELAKEVAALQSRMKTIEAERSGSQSSSGGSGASITIGDLPSDPADLAQLRRDLDVSILKRLETSFSAEWTRKVQVKLAERGLLEGEPSREFSPQTRAAIAEFQGAIGAKKTGYLTPAQLRFLITD